MQGTPIYDLQQFIDILKDVYKDNEPKLELYDQLEEVKFTLDKIAKEKEHIGGKIKLHCDHCGNEFEFWVDQMEFNWEEDGEYDRGMGPEMTYYSNNSIECPQCSNEIDLSFEVYEYPIGFYNYGNQSATGASIINECNLREISPINEDFFDDDDSETDLIEEFLGNK